MKGICTVIFWQDCYGKGHLRRFYKNTVGKKRMFVRWQRKGVFLSVYVGDIKLAGKKQNINPTWKILMKDVDLGEPTSFLTMFIWVAPKEFVRQSKIL